MENKSCPVCNKGNLLPDTRVNVISSNIGDIGVNLQFHYCDYCGVEITLSDDARINAEEALHVRKEAMRTKVEK